MRANRSKSDITTTKMFTFPSNHLDYELLDCGNQRKLERFGKLVLNRPEVEAKWTAKLPKKEWEKADWYFFEEKGKKGEWKSNKNAPKEWEVVYQNNFQLQFNLQLTNFKHIGIFPEQVANWDFIVNQIKNHHKPLKVLNLFAYTGAASIVAAKCGAEVTNVDSVKQVLNWGRNNAEKNKVDNIRWILEDAAKFVEKAIRRGDQFNGVIMDPPAFGYGAKKEKWKLENDLKPLLKNVSHLLNPQKHFFILNTYSPKMKMDDLKAILKEMPACPKTYEATTLALKSKQKLKLPLGNLIRWTTL